MRNWRSLRDSSGPSTRALLEANCELRWWMIAILVLMLINMTNKLRERLRSWNNKRSKLRYLDGYSTDKIAVAETGWQLNEFHFYPSAAKINYELAWPFFDYYKLSSFIFFARPSASGVRGLLFCRFQGCDLGMRTSWNMSWRRNIFLFFFCLFAVHSEFARRKCTFLLHNSCGCGTPIAIIADFSVSAWHALIENHDGRLLLIKWLN